MTATDTLGIGDIVIGERDRSDFGDITALAASIAAVGLLHPVVVTDAAELVAGGRRLAAVRSLGWETVPVTVVTLDNAEDVLRAEADENTQRKSLTPVEAERARSRRAKVLAPHVSRGGRPQSTPGAPAETGSKLDQVSGRVRQIAAAGTGYSGSTLDKVTEVREAAEDEVQPEPVREVAREQMAALDSGDVNPTQAQRELRAARALHDHVTDDPEYQRLERMKRFTALLKKIAELQTWQAQLVAQDLTPEDWTMAGYIADNTERWFAQLRQARPTGLRVVGGN